MKADSLPSLSSYYSTIGHTSLHPWGTPSAAHIPQPSTIINTPNNNKTQCTCRHNTLHMCREKQKQEQNMGTSSPLTHGSQVWLNQFVFGKVTDHRFLQNEQLTHSCSLVVSHYWTLRNQSEQQHEAEMKPREPRQAGLHVEQWR